MASIENCVLKQRAVFDIYGHLNFKSCYFKGFFTIRFHRIKDGSEQTETSQSEPNKVLKMIQCETSYVIIYFSIIEAAVQVEIITCDLNHTWVNFAIGNETACTQSFTFVNVTIVGCTYSHTGTVIKTTQKSVALIEVINTVILHENIKEDKSYGGLIGYIIENCTFSDNAGLRSFDAQYVRINNSKFIITEVSDCSEGCAVNVKAKRGQQSEILNEIFNPSCQQWRLGCGFVHVDNSEFIGSFGIIAGGVIRVEDTILEITNSVFRLTENSNPPPTGGFIFISGLQKKFRSDNVKFDAREFTGGYRVSLISSKVSIIKLNAIEILCPQGMMAEETLRDEHRIRHYTYLPACSHGEYTYQYGKMLLSGNLHYYHGGTKSLVGHNMLPVCYPCPVGANCAEMVSSLPNYWGYVNNNTLNMFRCPNGYCCQDTDACNSLDSCNRYRSGILCGSCKRNWTESLILENCVSLEGCNSRLIIGLYILVVIGYSFGLITFKTLKDRIVKILQLLYQKIRYRLSKKTEHSSIFDQSKAKDLEDGKKAEEIDTMKHIQILLYYVQDASLFKIKLPNSDKAKETVIVKILKFFADIVSNLYSHMENLCFASGTTPVTKIIFKSMLGPCIILFLLLTYGIQTITSKYIFSHSTFWKSFKMCLVRAFFLSVLFSYQQLLVAAFSIIQCVEIYGKMVLFLQSDITCFTIWQQFIQVFFYLNILPTFLVLSHASFYVAENKMSNNTFLLTCLFPIPTIIIYHLGRYLHEAKFEKPTDFEMASVPSITSSSDSNSKSDIEAFIELPSHDTQNKQSVSVKSDLQCESSVDSIKPESECSEKATEIKSKLLESECLDSGKEITKNMLDHYNTLKLFGFKFTWLAIHKMYRIALVALKTYMTDPLVRLLSMSVLLILICMINPFIKLYKKNETNVIASLSYLLNILIAILNICKAGMEKFGCKTNYSFWLIFINYVEVVENALLVYEPVGMIFFVLDSYTCKKR